MRRGGDKRGGENKRKEGEREEMCRGKEMREEISVEGRFFFDTCKYLYIFYIYTVLCTSYKLQRVKY